MGHTIYLYYYNIKYLKGNQDSFNINIYSQEYVHSMQQGNQGIYEFLVLDRTGLCLFHRDLLNEGLAKDPCRDKLISGLLWSMKSFASLMTIDKYRDKQFFKSYTTELYKLHFYEVPTGLKFVLLSKNTKDDLLGVLKHIYTDLFIPYVIKNVFYTMGDEIDSHLFCYHVDLYLNSLQIS